LRKQAAAMSQRGRKDARTGHGRSHGILKGGRPTSKENLEKVSEGKTGRVRTLGGAAVGAWNVAWTNACAASVRITQSADGGRARAGILTRKRPTPNPVRAESVSALSHACKGWRLTIVIGLSQRCPNGVPGL
jgi:hypothetical protein